LSRPCSSEQDGQRIRQDLHEKLVVLTVESIPDREYLPQALPSLPVLSSNTSVTGFLRLCADESGFLTSSQVDVCRKFLGGESLTCVGLLDPPFKPLSTQELRTPYWLAEFLCFLRKRGYGKATVVIRESRRQMVIPGNGVFRSLVAAFLLTVLLEIALIVFSLAMTP